MDVTASGTNRMVESNGVRILIDEMREGHAGNNYSGEQKEDFDDEEDSLGKLKTIGDEESITKEVGSIGRLGGDFERTEELHVAIGESDSVVIVIEASDAVMLRGSLLIGVRLVVS